MRKYCVKHPVGCQELSRGCLELSRGRGGGGGFWSGLGEGVGGHSGCIIQV